VLPLIIYSCIDFAFCRYLFADFASCVISAQGFVSELNTMGGEILKQIEKGKVKVIADVRGVCYLTTALLFWFCFSGK